VAEIDRPPRRVEVEVGVTEVLYSNGLVLAFDAIVPLIEPKDARDLVAAAVFNPSVVYGASGTPLPSQIEQTLRTRPNSSFFGRIARSPIVVQVLDPRVPGQTIEVEIPRETALVTADAQEINTRILLRPRLTLISGEEHEIFAGENLPVPNSASDAGSDPTPTGNPLRTSATIERRDVGVSLRVKPTVPEEGPIALEVSIEVSTLSGGRPGGPTFLERTLEARVYLESGRTAVIGTAEGPVTSDVRVGVPFLMDIPILGWLFRTEQRVERKASLLITLSAVRQHPEADELTQWMLDRLGEEPEDLAVVAP
jgi:type II secretory pathway component GspD/PulD (secretin)